MNLKTIRESANLTQHQLAKKSGVSRSALVRIELGVCPHPRVDTMEKLAVALGCSINDLVKTRTP